MMKKQVAAAMMALCLVAATGCGNKEVSDKYVKISQYKGVEAEKVTVEKVQDEEIDNYIQSVLEENRKEITDRVLKKGDIAMFEYVGKLGKEVFDEGTLTLGNGEQYVDGFEEGIYGHKAGETFELPITFPEGYGGEEQPQLSGAKVVFTIKITAIKEGKLPKLDDEFVQKVSKESKTVKEYKKEVKKILQKSNEETAKGNLADNAWKAVLENVEVKQYPEDRLKEAEKQITERIKKIITQYYGISYEDYLKQSGMTEKEFEKNNKESAKEYVKQVLTTELIAEKEGIKLSDKDYEKLMKEYAEKNGYKDAETMKKEIGETQIKEIILQDKVKEVIVKECKQVEPKEETEEPAAEEKTKESK